MRGRGTPPRPRVPRPQPRDKRPSALRPTGAGQLSCGLRGVGRRPALTVTRSSLSLSLFPSSASLARRRLYPMSQRSFPPSSGTALPGRRCPHRLGSPLAAAQFSELPFAAAAADPYSPAALHGYLHQGTAEPWHHAHPHHAGTCTIRRRALGGAPRAQAAAYPRPTAARGLRGAALLTRATGRCRCPPPPGVRPGFLRQPRPPRPAACPASFRQGRAGQRRVGRARGTPSRAPRGRARGSGPQRGLR